MQQQLAGGMAEIDMAQIDFMCKLTPMDFDPADVEKVLGPMPEGE